MLTSKETTIVNVLLLLRLNWLLLHRHALLLLPVQVAGRQILILNSLVVIITVSIAFFAH